MKRLYKYLLAAIVLPVLLVSCRMEERDRVPGRVEEGLPVDIRLEWKVSGNDVVTRVAQDSEYEFYVANIYLYVFKSDGSVYFKRYYEEGKGLNVTPGNEDNPTKGTLLIDNIKSINDVRIVGIANLDATGAMSAFVADTAQFSKVEKLEDLENMILDMRETDGTIERSTRFLMTGFAKDRNGSTVINIPGSVGDETMKLDCTLRLDRMDTKVKFVVTAEKPADKPWRDMSFKPLTFKVYNVPKQTLVLGKGNRVLGVGEVLDADGAGCTYFDSRELVFEEVTKNAEGFHNGGSFVFYMPENKKGPKKLIDLATGTKNSQYALREERIHINEGGEFSKPGQKFENGEFEYAPENASYVEMTGTLSYIDGLNYNVNAEVRFIVHLGYGSGNANDYNSERNTYYTYHVKVCGVDNIIVEVTQENGEEHEVRSGFEGDVVYAEDKVFEFDSHYDRRVISINRTAIKENMTWGVRTPFSSGVFNPNPPQGRERSIKGLEDYKWIKFAINSDYGVANAANSFVKYPGDPNYDDPDVDDGSDNLPSLSYPNHPDARLLDVNGLIDRLKTENSSGGDIFDQDGNVWITVFVDENLYFKNPVTGETGDQNRSLWKESVDKEDRILHIISGDSKYSQDGASSVLHSIYTFKQRAIRTVYNVNKETLKTAWGLESVCETGRILDGAGVMKGKGTSTRNGRENTIKWLEGKSWTEVISRTGEYGLNSGYDNAAYACLLRNRDLNGDNRVDAFEIRWYLAAIDQLVDIYLGQYALDEESRLYPVDPADRPGGTGPFWHYVSSSSNGGDYNNPWVLWAEEGASIGTYSNSIKPEYNGPRYSYRCIRNLGLRLANPGETPEDLISYKDNGDSTYTIDMSNMNEKSLRSSIETNPLPLHNELDPDNRPYRAFIVHNQDRGIDGKLASYYVNWQNRYGFENNEQWYYFQTKNVCPPGYRIPNQRELLIMATRLPEEAWKLYSDKWGLYYHEDFAIYMSQTAFSMNGKYSYGTERQGFMYKGRSNFYLRNGDGDTGFVRCVKDTAL